MGQYCFFCWHLSAGHRARGWSGDRHCMAGQYSYVPLGRTLAFSSIYLYHLFRSDEEMSLCHPDIVDRHGMRRMT